MIDYEEAKALREKDAFDPRNVRDEYKGQPNEVIRADLDAQRSDLVLCLSNQVRDMNLSSCIRSANSFNIDYVVMAGRKRYDRRGTVGAHHYIDVRHFDYLYDAIKTHQQLGYSIVALEYDESFEMQEISDHSWDSKTFLITGEEGMSLPPQILDLADDIVYIPMAGTVRSLNLASAVSIALYDYTSKVA